MSCEIEERSARGYCPGEEGHADEVCGTHELSGEVCPIEVTTTTTVAPTTTTVAPVTTTTVDPGVGFALLLAVILRVLLSPWGTP